MGVGVPVCTPKAQGTWAQASHLQPPSLREWKPSWQRSHFQPVTVALQGQAPELSHWSCRDPAGNREVPRLGQWASQGVWRRARASGGDTLMDI